MSSVRPPFLLAVQDRRHLSDEATWEDLAWHEALDAAFAGAMEYAGRPLEFGQIGEHLWAADSGPFSFLVSYQPA